MITYISTRLRAGLSKGQFVIGTPPGASCDYKFPSENPPHSRADIYNSAVLVHYFLVVEAGHSASLGAFGGSVSLGTFEFKEPPKI